uniref:Thioredoxin domain-containing protein n=1 Tax=Graphocephala atropunctata TaxID=36148 RepID=A0A1B6KMU8_9HEMI
MFESSKMNIYSTILIILIAIYGTSGKLEVVDDDALLDLINTEQFVVVLFTKTDCPQCAEYEKALLEIREDVVDQMNAYVVACANSMLVKLYDPNKEPSIVYFRHGVPLLYVDSVYNEELLLHTIENNQEPAVRELNDENFEHITQAASGATTGDWFVMFYATNCVECQRLQARWETVGSKLKRRLNIARVNRQTTGQVTSRRFGVVETPTFILFRQGKMYRYNIPKYDVASFVTFANDWYKNARTETVPVPKTPFDDLTIQIADYLRENPWLWKLGSIAVCIGVIASVILRLNAGRVAQKKKSVKKEKAEKEKTEKSDKAKKSK